MKFETTHQKAFCEAILTWALIVSLTEEEQTLIDQIAEQVVNGNRADEMALKAKSLTDDSLR